MWRRLKTWLLSLSHGKCWYSEAKVCFSQFSGGALPSDFNRGCVVALLMQEPVEVVAFGWAFAPRDERQVLTDALGVDLPESKAV